MANINKQITLTTKENSAGPYFDIYYSTDCTNFTICTDGSNVYLPSVSSTAIVTVPDNTICIKLINKNANCDGSFYVDAFGTTTTTSTTTIAPTTTTTTAGTTTTTTLNTQCYNYTYTAIAGCTIYYVDCNGVEQSQFVSAGQTVNLSCIRSYGQSGCGPFTQGDLCATTTTTLACYSCNDGVKSISTSSLSQGTYPTQSICGTSDECFILYYNAIERPNRFAVYNGLTQLYSSGWVGYADYAGPWGASLNVSPSGNSGVLQFTSTSDRYVLIDYGNSPDQSDTAEWYLSCATCPVLKQYNINGTNGSQVEYLNKFNQTETITFNNVNSSARVCAWSGSINPLTGGITSSEHLSYCPDNEYIRLYTSNATNSKAYTFESSSGELIQFFGANPTSYDITRCMVSGSYIKQSSSVYQLISNEGSCPTTTTTTTAAP